MAFRYTTGNIKTLLLRQMSTRARQNQTFILPDGRQLGYAEYGDHNGTPLLYFHGYPSCRLEAYPLDELARRHKVRIIGLDRPGYGLSTLQPNRRILDWSTDVLNFAKGMKLSRFALIGISGGGPYALACAYALPQDILIGVGLFASGPPWAAGAHHNSMYRRVISMMATYWPGGLRVILDALLCVSRWLVHTGPITRRFDHWLKQESNKKEFNGQGLENESPATLRKTTAERRLELVHALLDEPFAQGAKAAVDEARLLSSYDWGFSFERVRYNPVRIWHGAEDKNAPVTMIRYMVERLPYCVYREFEGDTHYTMFKHVEGAITELISNNKAD